MTHILSFKEMYLDPTEGGSHSFSKKNIAQHTYSSSETFGSPFWPFLILGDGQTKFRE